MTAALPFNTGGRCAPGWAAGGRSADVRFAGYRTPHLFATAARGDGPGVLIQPPVLSYSAILPVDWLIECVRVWRSRALPPAHLLRLVCDRCETYEDQSGC